MDKSVFQSQAIKALVNEWLGSVNFEDTPDISKMSPTQLNSYKNQAKAVLKNKAFIGEMKRLIDRYKETIALKANGDMETAFYRGAILACRNLSDALNVLALSGQSPINEN